MVGLTVTSFKMADAILKSAAPNHTQVRCTQSPCPCCSLLQIRTYTEDTQTQFCLSLCGVFGSWCAQGLFEPSEHLWQVWGLILNVILPLLPSCWGFSPARTWGSSSKMLQCFSASALGARHLSHWTVRAVPECLLSGAPDCVL